jgi:sucrose phosphorylase
VNRIHVNSERESLKATGTAASNLDLYQINCTYYDALARNDLDYLMARAIQFFVPGIPQVYYVGLFAGENDIDLLAKTNVGRDINRHYFTKKEIKSHLKRPLIQKLKEIILFRNEHPAFNGEFSLNQTSDDVINIKWDMDNEWAVLYIDLSHKKMKIEFSGLDGATAISFDEF